MAAKEKKGRTHNRKPVKVAHGIGFIAFYRGEEIAFAKDFGVLVGNSLVKARMGNRDLIIKHTVPEGMIAVYENPLSSKFIFTL